MVKTPDYTALARDYLNLMQQQMAGAMTHPQFVEAMLATLKTMDPRAHAGAKRHTPPASATGNDAVVRLERRVAKLERQLAAALDAVEQLSAKAQNPSRNVGGRSARSGAGSKARSAGTKAKTAKTKKR